MLLSLNCNGVVVVVVANGEFGSSDHCLQASDQFSEAGLWLIMEQCENGQINERLSYGATYRVGEKKVPPILVVPQPRNCRGDTVNSLRTRQLAAVIAEASDSLGAHSTAVAVEKKPVVAGHFFQTESQKQVNPDPDRAAKGSGRVATMSSLSHNHLNFCLHNQILAGSSGQGQAVID